MRDVAATLRWTMDQWLQFEVERFQFCVQVNDVDQVVPYFSYEVIPDLPDYVRGLCRIGGRIVPVVDLNIRLGWSPRPGRLEDHLVVLNPEGRRFALHVGQVRGVRGFDDAVLEESRLLFEGTLRVTGAAADAERGITLFGDAAKLLTAAEFHEISRLLEDEPDA